MNPLEGIVQFNKSRNLQVFNANNEIAMIALEMVELQEATDLGDEHEQVDAFADIVVFAVGAIHKMGYNPKNVLLETLLEINSRQGEMDPLTGKWEKFKNQDPVTLYKANYLTCKE